MFNNKNFVKECNNPVISKCAMHFVEDTRFGNITRAVKEFGTRTTSMTLFGYWNNSSIPHETYDHVRNTFDCRHECESCRDCVCSAECCYECFLLNVLDTITCIYLATRYYVFRLFFRSLVIHAKNMFEDFKIFIPYLVTSISEFLKKLIHILPGLLGNNLRRVWYSLKKLVYVLPGLLGNNLRRVWYFFKNYVLEYNIRILTNVIGSVYNTFKIVKRYYKGNFVEDFVTRYGLEDSFLEKDK